MKVLHVADAIDSSRGGGTAERTFQLASALHRAGVRCTVLCTDIGLGSDRRTELGSITLIAVPVLLHRFLIPRISSKYIERLVEDADVIHVTGHWSVLGARVCLAAQRLGKPYVYCPAGSLRIFGRSPTLKRLYNMLVGRRIVRGAARCFAVTELEREQFHQYGVSDEHIVLLPNGVRPNPEMVPCPQTFRARHGVEMKRVLLFLGRLSPIKGPDLLLKAFAAIAVRHKHAVLIFAGPADELGASLKVEAGRLGLLNQVLFVGFLAGQGKQDALAAADFLVVPSRQEAMSLVALEAGLCGTPVLLTDQCGFDEVESSGGGYVVAVQPEAIAEGIERMLNAAETLKEQGECLRQLVLSRYTWDGLTRQACELYEELVGGMPRSMPTNQSEQK